MELFTYLMAKNDHNTSVKKDLFSYLLGKNQSGTYTDYSGTSLSINNTKKAKMKVNLLGNTSQTGTPTPDNPIPVNVVSGDNEVVVIGKNFYNNENTQATSGSTLAKTSKGFTFTRTSTGSNDTFMATNELDLEPNTTYSIYASNSNFNAQFYFYTDTLFGNALSRTAINNTTSHTSYKFTTDGTGHVLIGFYVIGQSQGTSNTFDNIVLYKGTKTLTELEEYSPYQSTSYPIHLGTYELCKIGTYQDKFIRNSGKNLWDEEWEVGEINGSTGAKANTGSAIRSKNYIELDNSQTYYFYSPSGTIYQYDSSKTYIGALFGKANTTFNLASNCKYILFATATAYGTTYHDNICINVSNPDFNGKYEPYGNGDLYLEKHIGKYTFDGSETTTIGGDNFATMYGNGNIARVLEITNMLSSNNRGLTICNNFKVESNISIWNGTISGIQCYLNSNKIIISAPVSGIESDYGQTLDVNNYVSAYTNYLAHIDTYFYYILATPTYTKIEGTLAEQLEDVWRANSYKGQTNISQVNNDLPFNIDVSVKTGA